MLVIILLERKGTGMARTSITLYMSMERKSQWMKNLTVSEQSVRKESKSITFLHLLGLYRLYYHSISYGCTANDSMLCYIKFTCIKCGQVLIATAVLQQKLAAASHIKSLQVQHNDISRTNEHRGLESQGRACASPRKNGR